MRHKVDGRGQRLQTYYFGHLGLDQPHGQDYIKETLKRHFARSNAMLTLVLSYMCIIMVKLLHLVLSLRLAATAYLFLLFL
jgi:hypothetical protein